MKGKEQGTESDAVEFIFWHDVKGSEFELVRQTLKGHSQFQRVFSKRESIHPLPPNIELYRDDRKNVIGFLYPVNEQKDNKIVSSPASSPIVWEVLGRNESERVEF